MDKELTIENQWSRYEQIVMPTDSTASESDRREARDVFYTGASTMLWVFKAVLGYPDHARDAMLMHIENEVNSFLIEKHTILTMLKK